MQLFKIYKPTMPLAANTCSNLGRNSYENFFQAGPQLTYAGTSQVTTGGKKRWLANVRNYKISIICVLGLRSVDAVVERQSRAITITETHARMRPSDREHLCEARPPTL